MSSLTRRKAIIKHDEKQSTNINTSHVKNKNPTHFVGVVISQPWLNDRFLLIQKWNIIFFPSDLCFRLVLMDMKFREHCRTSILDASYQALTCILFIICMICLNSTHNEDVVARRPCDCLVSTVTQLILMIFGIGCLHVMS